VCLTLRLATPSASSSLIHPHSPHPLHALITHPFLVAAYGPYAASATGGNGFARDFLAGIAAMYSTPFFGYFPAPYTLEYPTTILAVLAFIVTIPIFVFYYKGAWFRDRSPFAQDLGTKREGRKKAGKEITRVEA